MAGTREGTAECRMIDTSLLIFDEPPPAVLRPPPVEFKPVPRTVAPPIAELIEEAELVPFVPAPVAPVRLPPPVVVVPPVAPRATVPEFKPVPRTVAPKKSELPVFDEEADVLDVIPSPAILNMPSESFVHKRIGGALRGLATGGPIGAAAGFLGGGAPSIAPQRISGALPGKCPGVGSFYVPGVGCVNVGDLGPAGAPAITQPGTELVSVPLVSEGMFGALSTTPVSVASSRLQCPKGLVLGKDERCYAKGTIPPKLRKWRPATRPPITAGDVRAIRRAASAKGRVKKLGKDVGLHLHVHRRAPAAKKGKK